VSGDFDVRCTVCGVKYDLIDSDPRPGYVRVANLTWGPNVLDGNFNESVIQSYAVFQVDPGRSETCNVGAPQHTADLNHVDLQYALSVIPKRAVQVRAPDGMSAGCNCLNDVYSVPLSWKLPADLSTVRLMISPVTAAGDVLPVGLTTGIIEDSAVSTTMDSAGGMSTTIEGSMEMQVSNASAFVSNPQVKVAIAKGIADTAGVPAQWVSVQLQLQTRRLGIGIRKLQGAGTVLVNYVITVPASAAGQNSSSSVSNVLSSLQNAQPAALTAAVTSALNEQVGTGAFDVQVTNVSAPIVRSSGATATTVMPTAAPSKAREKPAEEEEEDESNSGAVAGIVVGVLLALCCCCVIAAVVGKVMYDKRQAAAVQVYEINEVHVNDDLRGAAAGQDVPPSNPA